MPERLVADPNELRRIAAQHGVAAKKLREWGQIPKAWLEEFPDTYGSIADPMHGALVDYYNKRHDLAEQTATNHDRAQDQLLASATALEGQDEAGGYQVAQAGDFGHGAPSGGPTPGVPSGGPTPGVPSGGPTPGVPSGGPTPGVPMAPPLHAGPDTPMANSPQPVQPPVTGLPTAGASDGTARSEQVPQLPATSAIPRTDDILPAGAITPIGVTVPSAGGSGLVGGMSAPLATDAYSAPVAVAPVAPMGASAAARRPISLAVGPFAAAVHPTRDRRALPSFVVGERVEDDLALARTLLAAILAAVRDSARGVEWAVAVGRAADGPIVMLTSTEGPGWLPPGLFLPLEVVLPWQWFAPRAADLEAIAALEGTADPARMLAEFGSLVARRKNVWISALVSSAAIPDGVRAALRGDTAVEEWVSPAESAVDFTAPGPGLVDRLALAGSSVSLHQAATVPETEIRAKCLELARAADARVRAAVSGVDGETVIRRARRQQILHALHAGLPVPVNWWDQMRAADDMTGSALWSRRVDVSFVPVGRVRPGTATEALRGMVFERRADELLLLLAAGEPDRQTLRDVLYAYGQIAEHPMLPEAARVVHGVSVGSSHLGGVPPAIAESLNGPAGSEGSSERRRG